MSDDCLDSGNKINDEENNEASITLCLSPSSGEPSAAVQQACSLNYLQPPVQEAPQQSSSSDLPLAVIGSPLAASAASFPCPLPVEDHNHIYHASPVINVSCTASSMMAGPPSREPVTLPPPQSLRSRGNPSQGPRDGKDGAIDPPFPWSTDRRAVVHDKMYLLANGIKTISGEVQCKRCDHRMTLAYDLEEKYLEVAQFIAKNKHQMHDRAPPRWTNPTLPSCPECHQDNCLKPVVAPKKRAINWLFMLLGQTLGCCTLEQLKYFCKHTRNHRTGAKDRLIYLTFLGVCKQLDAIEMYNFDS